MATWRGIHWVAPVTMLGSLLLAVALACGHHLFYARLDKTAVGSATYSFVGYNATR